MQRALVVVVLEVDAGPEADEVLQGADVPLAGGVVQRRAARRVLLVEQLVQVLLRLGLQAESSSAQLSSGRGWLRADSQEGQAHRNDVEAMPTGPNLHRNEIGTNVVSTPLFPHSAK